MFWTAAMARRWQELGIHEAVGLRRYPDRVGTGHRLHPVSQVHGDRGYARLCGEPSEFDVGLLAQ